jgi:beta-lactamase regulating signal transducer with metallopeptidase domain
MNAWGQNAWEWAGWTMLHYLWIGAAIGVVTAFVRRMLRGAKPQVRYGVMLGALALLTLAPLGVAWKLSATLTTNVQSAKDNSRVATRRGIEPQALEQVDPSVELAAAAAERSSPAIGLSRNATSTPLLLDRIASSLPAVWLIGAPLTFLLLATGLVGAERLRNSAQVLTSGIVCETCERVRTALKLSRSVAVAASDRVLSPVLIGIVRPMILLPASALSGWSPEELELILTHELAHVRRWDNAVNLGQRVVESLLFFQPAVWVVSRWVRHDREECCDAVVVRHTNRPHDYAELLLSAAAPTPVVFAGAAMARSPVAARVRRILNLPEETMLVSRSVLVLGLLSLGLLAGVVLRPEAAAAQEEATAKDAKTAKAEEFAKEEFRYEGKSFEEWNRAWRTELSPERRVEAVKALGAFVKVGYEREALESLWNVAEEYPDYDFKNNDPESELPKVIVRQIYPLGSRPLFSPEVLLPVIEERAETKAEWVLKMAIYALPDQLDVREKLLALADGPVSPMQEFARWRLLQLEWERSLDKSEMWPTAQARRICRVDDPESDNRDWLALLKAIGINTADDSGRLRKPRLVALPQLLDFLTSSDQALNESAVLYAKTLDTQSKQMLILELAKRLAENVENTDKTELLSTIRTFAEFGVLTRVNSQPLKQFLIHPNEDVAIAALVAIQRTDDPNPGLTSAANVPGHEYVITDGWLLNFAKARYPYAPKIDTSFRDFAYVIMHRQVVESGKPPRDITNAESEFIDIYLELNDKVYAEWKRYER